MWDKSNAQLKTNLTNPVSLIFYLDITIIILSEFEKYDAATFFVDTPILYVSYSNQPSH